MKKYTMFLGIFIYLILCRIEVFAETITLEEIVVRGERQVDVEESLDIKEVRKTPARDIGEALKVIEGISSVRKGAIANDIVLRGFGRDDINVLIDGTRLHGACPNRMDPGSFHVDFAEIEKVSVQKGPFDVRNPGSLGGMVNIKTITPQRGWHATANTFAGSYENINTSMNASYGGDKMDTLFGYSYRYGLPYKDGDGNRITEQEPLASSANRYKDDEIDDKAYSIDTYWSQFGFNIEDMHRIKISYSRQEAQDVIYPYLLMDAVYDNTDRFNIAYEGKDFSGVINKLEAQFYFNQVKHDMTDWRRASSLGWAQGYMMRTFAETYTYGGKIGLELCLGDGMLSFGMDYYMRNWDAETTLPTGTQDSVPDVDMNNTGFYFEYAQDVIEKLSLTMGARFDHNKTRAGKDRSGLYNQYHHTTDRTQSDDFVSGNLQLSYVFDENTLFFTGFGYACRPPDPLERYFALEKPMIQPNWVGNPELDFVKNRELDFGMKYSRGVFLGKAMLFFSDIEDYISIFNAAGSVKSARSYRNVDATMYGGEITTHLFLPLNISFQGGISYTWARDDTFDKPLFEIPPLQGRIAVKYDNTMYFYEIEGVFADDQHRTDSDLNEEKTPGWGIVNLKAGITYKKFDIFAGINNLFDRMFFEHLSFQRDPFRTGTSVPEMGRSVYVNISCAL